MRRTSYEYEGGTGYLVKVLDTNRVNGQDLHQLARYSYDRAGNRITEQSWLTGSDGQLQRALQDQVLAYDRRNQLTRITSSVPGADYRIAYTYDAFGNREQVTTEYTNDIGHKKTITVDYKYDAMDRVREVSGKVNTLYDKPVYVPPRLPTYKQKDIYYEELPDDVGHYEPGDNADIEKHVISYDWAGNRASDNGESYQYDALGRLSEIRLGANVTGYRRYDSIGRVIEARNGAEVQLTDYDGARIAFQRTQNQSNGEQRSRVTYYYDADLGLLDSTSAQGASGARLQHTINTWGELRGTRLLSATTVRNDGNADFKTSRMEYDIGGVMSRVTAQVYKNGKLTDDAAGGRTMISAYNGQLLEKTQNGLRTHVLLANGQLIGENSASHETFSTVHEGLSTSTDANVGVYVVQSAGETLTSIAKALWGDERLWYLIADANGLTFSQTLTVGQPLTIPASAGTSYNGADTFQPYNAAEIIGSTTPEMALPVPQQSGGGCGGLGQLVMIVVAVVATIYTAGAASAMFSAVQSGMSIGAAAGSAFSAGFTATMTAGVGVMTGATTLTAGYGIAAGAIGGAMGSIASQTVGMAIGAQDGFSWKGVALSAIGSGASAGVAGLAKASSIGSIFQGEHWSAAAARAALSSTVTQGVSLATGLQDSFSWRGVAASAAGAAMGAQTNKYLSSDNAFGGLFEGNDISRATAVGFAAGMTTAVARGGKIDVVRIAADAFGNALGNSLAASARPSSSAATFEQDMDQRTAANPLLAAMSKQNRRDLASEILATQEATESLSGGQENGYASIPYSSNDLPRNTFPGATLGAFMDNSRSENNLASLLVRSGQGFIPTSGGYDYETYATLSDGTSQVTRHFRRGVDDTLSFAQDGVSDYFNRMDVIASAAGASTGSQVFAAATYGVRQIASHTINGIIDIPRVATSPYILPGLVRAVASPVQTLRGISKQFGALPTQDKLIFGLEVALPFKGNLAGLAGRAPRVGGYLAGDLGYSSGHGITLNANGKLYGFVGSGVANRAVGPYAYQAGAVGGLRLGEIAEAGTFRVANHGDMPSPRPGQHSHHGVMSAWVKANYSKYDPNLAPAVLMPEANHRATFGIYNTWRSEARTEMGGTFDWSKIPETRMLDLSERMFDAARVPTSVRHDYWEQYVRMKGKLTNE